MCGSSDERLRSVGPWKTEERRWRREDKRRLTHWQTNRMKWVRLMEWKIEESWASYLSTDHSQKSQSKTR